MCSWNWSNTIPMCRTRLDVNGFVLNLFVFLLCVELVKAMPEGMFRVDLPLELLFDEDDVWKIWHDYHAIGLENEERSTFL